MNLKKERWTILLFVSGILITEVYQLFGVWWPVIYDLNHRPNLFMDKSVVSEGQTLAWYIKDTSAMIQPMIWGVCFARICYKRYFRLFLLSVASLFYFAFDVFMYWHNFKSYSLWYNISYVIMGIVVLYITFGNVENGKMKKVE